MIGGKIKSFCAVLAICMNASAHDFSATVDGQTLYFEIVDKKTSKVAVTYKGSVREHGVPNLRGRVVIPAKVRYNDVVYRVASIGQKAFAGADDMKSIVLPSGIDAIGDFAFEGCDSLSSVIFPSNPVMFGQGVFFNCPAIENVTLGSEWRAVNLTMFRWSKKLDSVFIPAKVEKILGIGKLKLLSRIEVDANNQWYSTEKGMLYNKAGTILYACPRGCSGIVSIKEGTETVETGALADCTGVTGIEFPSTIKSVSFRETSRMSSLESIVLRGEIPLITGWLDGDGKFLFKLASPKVAIMVPDVAMESYLQVLATDSGEYCERGDSLPFVVTQPELPKRKSIKGVKFFEK